MKELIASICVVILLFVAIISLAIMPIISSIKANKEWRREQEEQEVGSASYTWVARESKEDTLVRQMAKEAMLDGKLSQIECDKISEFVEKRDKRIEAERLLDSFQINLETN